MRDLRTPGPTVIVRMLVMVLSVIPVAMSVWMVMVAEVIIVIGGVWVLMGGEVTHGGQVSFRNWRANSPHSTVICASVKV